MVMKYFGFLYIVNNFSIKYFIYYFLIKSFLVNMAAP